MGKAIKKKKKKKTKQKKMKQKIDDSWRLADAAWTRGSKKVENKSRNYCGWKTRKKR